MQCGYCDMMMSEEIMAFCVHIIEHHPEKACNHQAEFILAFQFEEQENGQELIVEDDNSLLVVGEEEKMEE